MESRRSGRKGIPLADAERWKYRYSPEGEISTGKLPLRELPTPGGHIQPQAVILHASYTEESQIHPVVIALVQISQSRIVRVTVAVMQLQRPLIAIHEVSASPRSVGGHHQSSPDGSQPSGWSMAMVFV